MSITLRDSLVHQCWAPVNKPPKPLTSPHHAVQVFGVIDDPKFRNFNNGKPFVDIVSYWPALLRWTVTMCSVGDEEATDVPVRVVLWQPMFMAPQSWP